MEIDEKFRPYLKTFPATELKPYAEPVSSQEMHVGRVILRSNSRAEVYWYLTFTP